MAPSKSISHKLAVSSSLRQGKLNFATTKPLPPALKGKGKKAAKRESEVSTPAGSGSVSSDEESAPIMKEEVHPSTSIVTEELDLQAKRWLPYYRKVKEKMGRIPPVLGDGETKIHLILRVFDNSHEYGPCVGVTRLERWERAHALGLNPPVEVREILTTKQGIEEDQFSQSVFYGQV